MLSIHFHGDLSNAELLFRTIISVNQLSVYGATSAWCEELAQQISDHSFSSTGKPVANMHDVNLNEFTFDQRSGTGKLVAKA